MASSMPSQTIPRRWRNYAGFSGVAPARSAESVRLVRALWPIVFLIPLSWWADRGCGFAGVDPLYHTTVWIHERLGWFVAALAAVSVLVVLGNIVVARIRFSRLLALAEELPERVQRAFATAGAQLGVRLPRIAYLDVSGPIATTVFGPVVLVSRGFADALDDDDLVLVARHELVHASRHDASVGVLWHLAFAALLLPGFEPLERRLHAARERRANAVAADEREEQYLALIGRLARGAALCAGANLGLEAAARRPEDRWLAWAAPLIIMLLAVALPLSHREFLHDRPYLLTHHC